VYDTTQHEYQAPDVGGDDNQRRTSNDVTAVHSPGFVTDRHDHTAGANKATFSPDGDYRYALFRRWGHGPTLCWLMLNPSTANAFREDNTSRRVIHFTKQAGNYGGLVIVNLFALRSTNPAALWRHKDPIGPLGDQFIQTQAAGRANVIAAWGTHGTRNGRGQHVAGMLADAGVRLHCLGTNGDGSPKHPLFVHGDTPLVPYRAGVTCHA